MSLAASEVTHRQRRRGLPRRRASTGRSGSGAKWVARAIVVWALATAAALPLASPAGGQTVLAITLGALATRTCVVSPQGNVISGDASQVSVAVTLTGVAVGATLDGTLKVPNGDGAGDTLEADTPFTAEVGQQPGTTQATWGVGGEGQFATLVTSAIDGIVAVTTTTAAPETTSTVVAIPACSLEQVVTAAPTTTTVTTTTTTTTVPQTAPSTVASTVAPTSVAPAPTTTTTVAAITDVSEPTGTTTDNGTGELPLTGLEPQALVELGLAFALAGAALVALSRRRQSDG